MKLTDTENKYLAAVRRLVKHKVEKLPNHPFGHAFLWGNVTFNRRLKNGNLKVIVVKVLFGGICVADLDEAVRLASEVEGVSGVWYNMD